MGMNSILLSHIETMYLYLTWHWYQINFRKNYAKVSSISCFLVAQLVKQSPKSIVIETRNYNEIIVSHVVTKGHTPILFKEVD